MNKPLVIYHNNCADGFGAAFAAWLRLGDEAEYYPMQYGYDLLPDFKGREVHMLDFSWKKEHMDDLFAAAKRVVWLDHHKTSHAYAEEKCGESIGDRSERHNKALDIIHDNDKSGALLAWEHFHPDAEVPMMLKHIDDYDRWQFKLDGTKEFNKALWSYSPWSFEQWREYMSPQAHVWMVQEGAAILRAHNQNVQSVVKGATRKCEIRSILCNLPPPWRTPVGVVSGLAANCPPHLTSDVGHELAVQSGTFGLCWTLAKDDMVAKCSLRSNGDYDVSAIAKAFGGGGHKNAAGFEVPISVLLGWLS